MSDPEAFGIVKDIITTDIAKLLDSEKITIRHLRTNYPERKYQVLFNKSGEKGKKLCQRFSYISRLRQKEPEKFRKEVELAQARLFDISDCTMVFGFEKSAARKPDPVKSEAIMTTAGRPKVDVSDVHMSAPKSTPAKADQSHYEMFAHLTLEELQQFCKYYNIILYNKYRIKTI